MVPIRPSAHLAALGALLLAGCTATISDPGHEREGQATAAPGGQQGNAGGAETPSVTPESCAAEVLADPGPAISRRLTRTEYNHTVHDLLGTTASPAEIFPAEEISAGFDNNPSVLSVSPVLVEHYFDAAEALALEAAANWSALVSCSAADGADCAAQYTRTFGKLAFRRPLTDAEVTRYLAPFQVGAQTDFQSGIRLVITALLQAAPFLYRVELGGAAAPVAGYVKLTSWEMASRLSYLLWQTTPDGELLQAAEAGKLETAAEIESQARRLLLDARAKHALVDFHTQWLELRNVATLEKDAGLFPSFDAEVASDMQTQTARFLEEVFAGQSSAERLFSADFTFLNGRLSSFYGFGSVSSDEFVKVSVPSERRGGILALGGLLAAHAKTNQTSPVQRGKFVREQLLCQPLTPPPSGMAIMLPALSATLTTRERFDQHSTDPACAGCHALMDPIGLGFEGYDAVGRYRTTENGQPVDTSGELGSADVTGAFDGLGELASLLGSSADVKACMVTNWFRYASARPETSADACTLLGLTEKFASSGYDLSELLVSLTQTDAFLYRRASTQGDN